VHSIESDAGRCSANFEQSPTGLQFLFSQGIAERSATHNAIPCPENSVEESDVHKVECQVETAVSSKSDSYNCSDENSVRVEESGGCTFSSQQNNEQEGISLTSFFCRFLLDYKVLTFPVFNLLLFILYYTRAEYFIHQGFQYPVAQKIWFRLPS
jgi:hypothetical protein